MAQVITTIPLGKHSQDLHRTNERLTALGCWKKQRIAQVIPMGATIPGKAYISHLGLVFPANQQRVPIGVEGAEVGSAYEAAVDAILGNKFLREFEYMLTVEADNVPPSDGVLRLLVEMEAHPEFAAISGLYFTKGPGGVPQIWGDISDPIPNYRPMVPRTDGGLVECYGIGMGFAMFRVEMLRKLEKKKIARPWFKTSSEKFGICTQDLHFWGNVARPNGFRCAVSCGIHVGHLDPDTGTIW